MSIRFKMSCVPHFNLYNVNNYIDKAREGFTWLVNTVTMTDTEAASSQPLSYENMA